MSKNWEKTVKISEKRQKFGKTGKNLQKYRKKVKNVLNGKKTSKMWKKRSKYRKTGKKPPKIF